MAWLIDVHTHTSHSLPCGHRTAEELIEAAIKVGLDRVAVTEHLVVEGVEVAQKVTRNKYGFPMFRGVEARATILGDMLVFGRHRGFEPQLSWAVLCLIVGEADGVLVPAHPFCHWDRGALWNHVQEHNLRMDARLQQMDPLRGPTAIEVQNGGNSPAENARASDLARILGLPGVRGSDGHVIQEVGRVATRFPRRITTDTQLVATLKRGGYPATVWRKQRRLPR